MQFCSLLLTEIQCKCVNLIIFPKERDTAHAFVMPPSSHFVLDTFRKSRYLALSLLVTVIDNAYIIRL